jgi:hypothetical protein
VGANTLQEYGPSILGLKPGIVLPMYDIKIRDKATGELYSGNQMDAEDRPALTTTLGGGSIEI